MNTKFVLIPELFLALIKYGGILFAGAFLGYWMPLLFSYGAMLLRHCS